MGWFLLSLLVAGIVWWDFSARSRNWATRHEMLLRSGGGSRDPETSLVYERDVARSATEKAKWSGLVVIVPGLVVVAGAAAWMAATASDARGVENRLAAYQTGWAEGWQEGCTRLFFKLSPSGDLYSGGQRYTYDWCTANNRGTDSAGFQADVWAESTQWEEVAHDAGWREAYGAAVDQTFSATEVLCYGEDCITRVNYQD
jgi:hypothetical protein